MNRPLRANWYPVLIVLIALLLSGCMQAGPTLPTRVPAAVVPTVAPTAAAVANAAITAADDEGGENEREDEAATPAADSPTRRPRPTSTPEVEPEVRITSPELTTISGEPLSISGRLIMGGNHTAEAVVVAPSGALLGAIPVRANEFGTFAAEVPTALWFAGIAVVRVTVFERDGAALKQHQQPVRIEPNTQQERYLEVYRPQEGETAGVSGYYLFFDGYAERPAGFRVAITLLDAECRTDLARQSYAMRGSGYWQGFIVVPEEASGTICAMISFGEVGSEDRREIQLPINVLPVEERDAPAVLISNPPPGSSAVSGRLLNIYGTAYLAPGSTVQLTVLLGDGTIAATETAEVTRYGYWETDLLLPVNLAEEGLLRATIGPINDPLAVDEMFLEIGN